MRVEDILQEIENQLGPLKDQSLIAEQNLKLGAEKKLLEIQLLVRDLAEVQKKLAGVQADSDELKTGLVKAMLSC